MNKRIVITIGILFVVVLGTLFYRSIKFNSKTKQEDTKNNKQFNAPNQASVTITVNEENAFPISSSIKLGGTLKIQNLGKEKITLNVTGPATFEIPITSGAIVDAPVFGAKEGTYTLLFGNSVNSKVTVETTK